MGMTTRTPQLYGTEKGVRPHACPDDEPGAERIGQSNARAKAIQVLLNNLLSRLRKLELGKRERTTHNADHPAVPFHGPEEVVIAQTEGGGQVVGYFEGIFEIS